MANILQTLLIIFQLLFVSWSFDITVARHKTGDLFSIPNGKCPIGSEENDVTCKCKEDTSTFHVFENKTYGCYKRRDIEPSKFILYFIIDYTFISLFITFKYCLLFYLHGYF